MCQNFWKLDIEVITETSYEECGVCKEDPKKINFFNSFRKSLTKLLFGKPEFES